MKSSQFCCSGSSFNSPPPLSLRYPHLIATVSQQTHTNLRPHAAKSGGFSWKSVANSCKTCKGQGAIECAGCKGTRRNKKNGNIFERWKFLWDFFVLLAMDQSRSQGSIQMLLSAEHEAQQIVAAARNLKLTRLKQAKEEADREVANYRAQMEAEYQKSLSESSGSSGSTVKRLEAETEAKIRSLKETAGKVSPEVVKMLLKHIIITKS